MDKTKTAHFDVEFLFYTDFHPKTPIKSLIGDRLDKRKCKSANQIPKFGKKARKSQRKYFFQGLDFIIGRRNGKIMQNFQFVTDRPRIGTKFQGFHKRSR